MERKRGFKGGPAFVTIMLLGAFALAGCGGGGATMAGGGTGGTGISTGAITGFGSVDLHEVRFITDNNTVRIRLDDGPGNIPGLDNEVFRVGMVVTIVHGANDNNATEIEFRDNMKGPVGSKTPGADNTITVLGQTVVVDDAGLFALLADNNVVEASGYVDNGGRIRATFLEVKGAAPQPGEEFEVKGFVSGLNTADNSFFLGPLPDGTGVRVEVGYTTSAIRDLPGGPSNGMYAKVKTVDVRPTAGRIEATKVERAAARTDLPEATKVSLEGLVTRVTARSANAVSFDLEGKSVVTGASTVFLNGAETGIQPNASLQAEGTITAGTLSADRIVFR